LLFFKESIHRKLQFGHCKFLKEHFFVNRNISLFMDLIQDLDASADESADTSTIDGCESPHHLQYKLASSSSSHVQPPDHPVLLDTMLTEEEEAACVESWDFDVGTTRIVGRVQTTGGCVVATNFSTPYWQTACHRSLVDGLLELHSKKATPTINLFPDVTLEPVVEGNEPEDPDEPSSDSVFVHTDMPINVPLMFQWSEKLAMRELRSGDISYSQILLWHCSRAKKVDGQFIVTDRFCS
jgi:hypothetical protein